MISEDHMAAMLRDIDEARAQMYARTLRAFYYGLLTGSIFTLILDTLMGGH